MNFDEKTDTRLRIDEIKKIDKIIRKKKGVYSSRSHFVRCAILRLIKKESED